MTRIVRMNANKIFVRW